LNGGCSEIYRRLAIIKLRFCSRLKDYGGLNRGFRVNNVLATARKAVVACLIMLVLAALAGLGVSLSAGSLRSATPSPAEIVASRFPPFDSASPAPATFSTASVMPVEHWETFDPALLSPMVMTDPAWPAPSVTTATEATSTETGAVEPSIFDPPPQSAAPAEAVAETEPPKTQATGATQRRATARSSNVLNEAQIASIKRRLKLTAEQERMWPAVEAALRKVVYTKHAMEPRGQASQPGVTPVAYIDPTSNEVRQLKSAALPLLMRLNDDQKRELKMLAYVMGLEAVAAQF
jgi:hypothetical protein